jgi:hypothetical protein
MKKICTRCGNALNMAEKQCACGAFNPFYIASHKATTPLNIQIAVIEEETSLKEINALSAITAEQKQGTGTELQQEILRVKDETEQYKRQTLEMVEVVRQELHHIDEENKRLKQEVEMLSLSRISQPAEPKETFAPAPPAKAEKRFFAVVTILFIAFCIGLGYFLTVHKGENNAVALNRTVLSNQPVKTAPPAVITKAPVASNESAPAKKLIAAVTPAPQPQPVAAPAIAAQPKVNASISEAKVKGDLIGNKLSGCGITVNNPGEIAALGNLALITREPSGETKYKFSTRIVQGGETFNATPYIYYDANGVFVRIDGTNCE